MSNKDKRKANKKKLNSEIHHSKKQKLIFTLILLLFIVLVAILYSGIFDTVEITDVNANCENTVSENIYRYNFYIGVKEPVEKEFTIEVEGYDKKGNIILTQQYNHTKLNSSQNELFVFSDTNNVKTIKMKVINKIGKVVANKTCHVKKVHNDIDYTLYTSSYSSKKSTDSSDSNKGSSSRTPEDVFAQNVLERYDIDSDGELSSSEWDTWCLNEGYDSMNNCDKNGDGYCSYSELCSYSHNFGY